MIKRIFALFAAALLCAVSLCLTVYADDKPYVQILDYGGHINTDNEIQILEKADEVAGKTGFNIIIYVCDDVGSPKTDAHVVELADDTYEQLCGINTDGVLLLINNDTKYDYISTSGKGINYLSDSRIDRILDGIWDDLKDENYAQAAYSFLFYLEDCYDAGMANHQTEIGGVEIDTHDMLLSAFITFIFTGFVALIVGLVIFVSCSAQYKMEKPVTRIYMLKNSLSFLRQSDDFKGTFTNRVYSPQSSGSHHSGGSHSHHSSTHHSHSGGRHGGGGRHR